MTPDQNLLSRAEPDGRDISQVPKPAAMAHASLHAFASTPLGATLASPGQGAFEIVGREETETPRVRRLTFEKLNRSVTQIPPQTAVHTGTRSRLFSLPSHPESQVSRFRPFVSRGSSPLHNPTATPHVILDPEERMPSAERNAETAENAGNMNVAEDARSDCLLM